jgi:hypothetical protein
MEPATGSVAVAGLSVVVVALVALRGQVVTERIHRDGVRREAQRQRLEVSDKLSSVVLHLERVSPKQVQRDVGPSGIRVRQAITDWEVVGRSRLIAAGSVLGDYRVLAAIADLDEAIEALNSLAIEARADLRRGTRSLALLEMEGQLDRCHIVLRQVYDLVAVPLAPSVSQAEPSALRRVVRWGRSADDRLERRNGELR